MEQGSPSTIPPIETPLNHLPIPKSQAQIPTEIWIQVLKHLDHISLCRLSQASTFFQSISNDNTIWKTLCSAVGVKPKPSLIEVLHEIQQEDSGISLGFDEELENVVGGEDEIAKTEKKIDAKGDGEKDVINWKALFIEYYESEKMYRFRRRSFCMI
ncbi:hypothetical protein HDU67_001984 [Dinochytrium kinnereticum]|nr:hypothetical protein HDU67_001984 [Dinochytrium kinnereticum]